MRNATQFLIAGLLALGAAGPLQADDRWQHTITPYLFAAGMDGTTGVGPVTADVSLSFGDILDNLSWGAMLAYEGQKGPYSIAFDLIYMDLEADKTGPNGLISGDAQVQQTALEVDFGYDVMPRVTVFGGLRYNNLDVDVRVRGSGPLGIERKAGGSETWVDPVIGVRGEYPFAKNWSAGLRGDIGGFGVGSDFAWQVVSSITWHASERIGVTGAYRYFQQDYENGSGASFFKYDIATSGPQLGVAFTF